jgi:hypothetical protein
VDADRRARQGDRASADQPQTLADDPVPPEVVHDLVSAAQAAGARLFPITRPEHRLAAARLSQRADQPENTDPAYRAELAGVDHRRSSTSPSLHRRAPRHRPSL